MATVNTQNSYKETADQFSRQSQIYKETFESTQGDYQAKSKAAQEAVARFRRVELGEKFRSQVAQHVAQLAPMPEAGDANSELTRLSREKVSAWLERYQGGIAEALASMFGLDPKYKMTDIELARFSDELKTLANLEQKTFFALTDWIQRIKRDGGRVPREEAEVVDRLLTGIATNQAPANLTAKAAA